jgi:hypothetical protein
MAGLRISYALAGCVLLRALPPRFPAQLAQYIDDRNPAPARIRVVEGPRSVGMGLLCLLGMW